MKRWLMLLPVLVLYCAQGSAQNVPAQYSLPHDIAVRVGSALKIDSARLSGQHTLYAGSRRIDGNRLTITPAAGGGLDAGNGLVCDAARCLPESEAMLEVSAGAQSRRVLLRGEVEFFNEQGRLLIVARIPFEEYIRGVVFSECGNLLHSLPEPARREFYTVMAACARSWVLAGRQRHDDRRYRVCDLTHCQHFQGCVPAMPSGMRRLVLLRPDTHDPLSAWYHSTCGGRLTQPQVMWPDADTPAGCFRGGADRPPAFTQDGCAASPHHRWQTRCSEQEMEKICGMQNIERIDVLAAQGRIRALRVHAGGTSAEIPVARFLSRAGQELGWNRFKSNDFELRRDEGWLVSGRGLGHGVGLCQYGAAAMVRAGGSSEDVLRFYFPGALLCPAVEAAGE